MSKDGPKLLKGAQMAVMLHTSGVRYVPAATPSGIPIGMDRVSCRATVVPNVRGLWGLKAEAVKVPMPGQATRPSQ